jgi:hypothetical protein
MRRDGEIERARPVHMDETDDKAQEKNPPNLHANTKKDKRKSRR